MESGALPVTTSLGTNLEPECPLPEDYLSEKEEEKVSTAQNEGFESELCQTNGPPPEKEKPGSETALVKEDPCNATVQTQDCEVPQSAPPLEPSKPNSEDSSEPTESPTESSEEVAAPAAKRRRSPRHATNTIPRKKEGSLQHRRMDQLFFCSDPAPELLIEHLKLQRISSSPHIYIIDNFLTATELAHLKGKIASGTFEKSYVDSMGTKEHSLVDASHRTSTFMSFESQQDAKIATIERRAASILGCWSAQNIEPLQLVRYLPRQFFKVHHDLGDLSEDGSVALPPKSPFCKRRLVTIFCYMNTVEQGGATYFPAPDVRVQPVAGRAVVFSNITHTYMPDARTIHAGEPPTLGLKYGLNIWICED